MRVKHVPVLSVNMESAAEEQQALVVDAGGYEKRSRLATYQVMGIKTNSSLTTTLCCVG